MSTTNRFEVTFWGVRGGYPVPGPGTVRYGGNTTCLEVRAGDHLIIIDSGTGIVPLGRKLSDAMAENDDRLNILLLITHTHHDHIQGFPFFAPAYSAGTTLNIFGPKLFPSDLEEVLRRSMMSPRFPVSLDELPCNRRIGIIRDRDMIVLTEPDAVPQVINVLREEPSLPGDTVRITALRSLTSHPDGITFYRIEYQGRAMVFASDTEGYIGGNQQLIRFAKGAHLLIHDAELTEEEYMSRQGWGHSTWQMACDVGRQAGVERLALTHHNAMHDDDELDAIAEAADAAMPGVFLAHEGRTIDLCDD
ncbi:MAG: MBL fold metallo-hydrolase [Anaerolineae bacterium]